MSVQASRSYIAITSASVIVRGLFRMIGWKLSRAIAGMSAGATPAKPAGSKRGSATGAGRIGSGQAQLPAKGEKGQGPQLQQPVVEGGQ